MQKGLKNIVIIANIFFAFYIISSFTTKSNNSTKNTDNKFSKNSTCFHFQKSHFFVPKKVPNTGTEQNEENKIENENNSLDVVNKIYHSNKNWPVNSHKNLINKNCLENHFSKVDLYIYFHSLKIPFEIVKIA
jgi:hypothetical protein